MNGPCFLPSGSRLGPYFWRRVEASPTARPFSVLVVSRFSTSSTVGRAKARRRLLTWSSLLPPSAFSFRIRSDQLLDNASLLLRSLRGRSGTCQDRCAAKLPVASVSMARK